MGKREMSGRMVCIGHNTNTPGITLDFALGQEPMR